MRRIPFPLESYQHPSKPLSSKALLNMMAEQAPADARTQAALVSTPGLQVEQVIGTGPIYAMNDDLPGRVYVVSGTRFYRLRPGTDGYTALVDDLGDIGTPSGTVGGADLPDYVLMYTIACTDTAAVVCVPPNAFTCGHAETDALNPIGGDTWPGAQSVAAHDGYHIFVSYENSAKFFISHLLDPTMFDALDFAYSDGLPNVLRRVFPYRTDLWMMGEGGVEIWYDAGSSGLETTPGFSFFPYRRRSGGVFAYSVASPQSVAAGDGSVFWVSLNGVVFRTKGYQAERISTHATEAIVRDLNPYTVVSAFTYTQLGHVFYVLNWATRTLVYDCATKVWHDRASPDTGRWRCNATAMYGTQLLFGDIDGGSIFRPMAETPYAGLEIGDAITRQIVFPPIWAGTNRAFCSRFEVEMESGDDRIVGQQVTLDWSDDGGHTFNGGPRVMLAGTATQKRKRLYTTRLGSFRQRVFRLTLQGACTVYAADCDITGGAS
jgi:hypothetical protein